MSEIVLNATLVHRHDFNPELAVFKVRPDSGRITDFDPGQFAMLGLPGDPGNVSTEESETPDVSEASLPGKPKMIKRAYSIASPSTQKDSYDFYIVLIKDGKLTPKLWAMNIGDKIWLDDKIKGKFSLKNVPSGKDLVMISTGTGLAPFYSMLKTYQHENRWRRFIVVNGVRYSTDLGYREEFEQAAREDPSVYFFPYVTRDPEDSGYTGMRGRVYGFFEGDTYQRLVGAPLDPDQCHVFLCGHPDMIKTLRVDLEKRGFKGQAKGVPGNIHFELYW
jgi:ferredoxin--NADP+ reductase